MHSIKKSNFTASTAVSDTDYFDFVRNGTNIKVSFADIKSSMGITIDLNPIGSPLGNPTLIENTPTSFSLRSIESGSGILAQISPLNGIEVGLNLTQDVVGSPIFAGLGNTKPDVASIDAGSGISVTKTNNVITILNTQDPATGLANRVVVTEAADLAGSLDSTKEYFLDGIIDMGAQSIEVPVGGINITGYNFDLSKLTSSENSYTMFTSPVGGSGDMLSRDYAIEVTGTSSQVYNLTDVDGTHAFEFARVNYSGCTSLGTISSYRQGLEVGTGRFGGKPQLTLAGTWSGGYFIDTSIVRSLDDGAYSLFAAGAGFSMSSRFRTNQNVDLPASASFVDFAPSNFVNPSTLQLDGVIMTRDGVFDASDSNLTPNVSASDLVSEFMACTGVENTFVGGETRISVEVLTSIVSDGVYVDLAGTFSTSELVHFDSPSNGQLRHLGNSPREFQVAGGFVIDGTSNDVVALKAVIWRDATSSFEDGTVQNRVINSLQGIRNVAYYAYLDNIVLDKNDYVKFQVANIGSTDDVTAEIDTAFFVQAR